MELISCGPYGERVTSKWGEMISMFCGLRQLREWTPLYLLHLSFGSFANVTVTQSFDTSIWFSWWDYLTRGGAVHSRMGNEWHLLQSYSLVGVCWKFVIRWGSLVREVSITSSVQLNTISIQLWLHLQYWWGPLGSPFSYIGWSFLLCSASKRWNLCL